MLYSSFSCASPAKVLSRLYLNMVGAKTFDNLASDFFLSWSSRIPLLFRCNVRWTQVMEMPTRLPTASTLGRRPNDPSGGSGPFSHKLVTQMNRKISSCIHAQLPKGYRIKGFHMDDQKKRHIRFSGRTFIVFGSSTRSPHNYYYHAA